MAVVDADCSVEGGFDEVDEEGLARFAKLIARSCDWGGRISPFDSR